MGKFFPGISFLVAILPGQMALTLILRSASSSDTDFVSPSFFKLNE